MKASPELREKMWELCYDLLPDAERSALIARIKSDPHAARLYAEVRLQADLVGYAATIEDSSLNLRANAESVKNVELAPLAGRHKDAFQAPAAAGRSNKPLWAANALAVAAGLALVLLLAVGFFRPFGAVHQMAQLVVTEVEVPRQLTPGVTSKFAIRTASAASQPLSVPVDVKVVDPAGNVLHHELVSTNSDGRGEAELPGPAIRPGTRLWVEARGEESAIQSSAPAPAPLAANLFETPLPVRQPAPVTYYWIEKPVVGEGMRVAGVALDPIILTPQAPPTDEVEVKEAELMRRVRPAWNVRDHVAEAMIPPASGEALERAVRLAEGLKHKQEVLVHVARAKDASAVSLVPESVALSQSAGGSAAPAGDFRFRAEGVLPPAAAEPAAAGGPADRMRGAKALAASGDETRKENETDKQKVAGQTKEVDKAGAGGRDVAQEGAEKFAAGQLTDPQADVATVQSANLEATGARRQTVDQGRPVEVELPAHQLGRRYHAVVRAREVEVLKQTVEPRVDRLMKEGQELEQRAKITVSVPPEVDGNFEVAVIDSATSDVVAKRELYRVPSRLLRFVLLNGKDRYEPGEVVRLRFKVVNEHGEPVPAAAAARVWNEDYVPDDRSRLVMLEDAVWKAESPGHEGGGVVASFGRPGAADRGPARVGGELPLAMGLGTSSPSQLAQSAIRPSLAEQKKMDDLAGAAPATAGTVATTPPAPSPPAAPAPPAPAIAPSDPAGGQLARSDPAAFNYLHRLEQSFGSAPASDADTPSLSGFLGGDVAPLIASNELLIRRELALLKSSEQRATSQWRTMFGRVLIGAGLAVAAILGLLFVLRQDVRWSSGTLALVASAASLVIGAAWITGGQQDTLIALAPGRSGEAVGTAAPAEALPKAAAPAPQAGDFAEDMREDVPSAALYGAAPLGPPGGAGGLDAAAQTPSPALDASANPAPADRPAGKGRLAPDELEKFAPARTRAASDQAPNDALPLSEQAASDDKSAAGKAIETAPGQGLGGFGGGRGFVERRGGARAPTAPAATTPAPAGGPQPPAPSEAPPPSKALALGGAEERAPAAEGEGAPAALYFNPQLQAAADGTVTIEFQLPPVASQYRVLLDAYGNGRVGSSADWRIVCKAAE
jgi:hypothetical protein